MVIRVRKKLLMVSKVDVNQNFAMKHQINNVTYRLLVAGTVVVLVLNGLEKIHVEDLHLAKRREKRHSSTSLATRITIC